MPTLITTLICLCLNLNFLGIVSVTVLPTCNDCGMAVSLCINRSLIAYSHRSFCVLLRIPVSIHNAHKDRFFSFLRQIMPIVRRWFSIGLLFDRLQALFAGFVALVAIIFYVFFTVSFPLALSRLIYTSVCIQLIYVFTSSLLIRVPISYIGWCSLVAYSESTSRCPPLRLFL